MEDALLAQLENNTLDDREQDRRTGENDSDVSEDEDQAIDHVSEQMQWREELNVLKRLFVLVQLWPN